MLIFFAVNFFVNENDFDEFFGSFTIYLKMYKLFIIYLALDRNGKLINLKNVDNCKIFDGEHQPELFEVLYLTGI